MLGTKRACTMALAFVAAVVAGSVTGCGSAENSPDSRSAGIDNSRANLIVYATTLDDKTPSLRLGSASQYGSRRGNGWGFSSGPVSNNGCMIYGPYVTTSGPGVTYAEVDLTVSGSRSGVTVSFTADKGNRVLQEQSLQPGHNGVFRFNGATHPDGVLSNIEVRVCQVWALPGAHCVDPAIPARMDDSQDSQKTFRKVRAPCNRTPDGSIDVQVRGTKIFHYKALKK